AILMKVLTAPILRRTGHRTVLRWNTFVLGEVIVSFSQVGPGSPLLLILGLSFIQGFFTSLELAGANSRADADASEEQTSGASATTSTGQQMSMSVGIAVASLLATVLMNGEEAESSAEFVSAVHRAFWV